MRLPSHEGIQGLAVYERTALWRSHSSFVHDTIQRKGGTHRSAQGEPLVSVL
jgi:hypothetical protein